MSDNRPDTGYTGKNWPDIRQMQYPVQPWLNPYLEYTVEVLRAAGLSGYRAHPEHWSGSGLYLGSRFGNSPKNGLAFQSATTCLLFGESRKKIAGRGERIGSRVTQFTRGHPCSVYERDMFFMRVGDNITKNSL